MIKKLLIISLILLTIAISSCIKISERIEERSYPNIDQSYSNLAIHELKEFNYTSGNYNVEGYVVKIYTCPPCPRGAMCKPCMRDNIVVSEKNELLDVYYLSASEIIIFCENPKQFQLGHGLRPPASARA